MADELTVQVHGIDDLKRVLSDLPRKLRTRILARALRSAGKVIQAAARAHAPVLKTAHPHRTAGLVRRKISVRTSKFARQDGDVGVFVGVRPAAGARYRKGVQVRASARGAHSRLDPYYWRFVEFGTRAHIIRPRAPRKALTVGGRVVPEVRHPGAAGVRFLTRAADHLPRALAVFQSDAVAEITALDRSS